MRLMERGVTIVIGMVLATVLVVMALMGCGPKPKPEKPAPIVIERRACIDRPPPEPGRGIVWLECDGYATCLSRESAVLVLTYLRDIQRYATDAWVKCGPLPEKEKTP